MISATRVGRVLHGRADYGSDQQIPQKRPHRAVEQAGLLPLQEVPGAGNDERADVVRARERSAGGEVLPDHVVVRGRAQVTWWRRPYLWATASALAVLVANVGGLAIGDDGVGYRATADSLVQGRGLGYFLERPLTIWPPGWPMLMAAVAKVTPLDTEQAAVALDAATAFLIVVLVHRLLLRLVRDERLVMLGTAVSALGAFAMVFGHLLMTDFSFAAVTLALFLALLNYRERAPTGVARRSDRAGVGRVHDPLRRHRAHRHRGPVAPPRPPARRLCARLRDAAIFGVAAAAVPLAWIARNLTTDDTASACGTRPPAASSRTPSTRSPRSATSSCPASRSRCARCGRASPQSAG